MHDGIVDRFDRSLDDYPAWLREQEEKFEQAAAKWQDDPAKTVNRRQQRQEQAQLRQRLKPLRDKVQKVEKALGSNRARLTEVEQQLADESLYADPNRKDELTKLIKEQAAVKATIEQLEWEWLEASEELEQAT